jgi:hypothetical protein
MLANNHTRFIVSDMNSTLSPEVETLAAARKTFFTTAELRQLLKQNLGLNARQVTVSGRNSITYLTITVRDASVDVAKVKEFAKSCDTWKCDQSDYCSGQSINVETTKEVDAIHAAPFVAEISATVKKMQDGGTGCGDKLSTGAFLWRQDREYYVGRMDGNRGCYVWRADVDAFQPWAITALALQMSRI